MGEYNVIAYKKYGEWTYQLGSVIKNSTREDMERGFVQMMEDPQSVDENAASSMLNGLAVARYVNVLAHQLGMRSIMDISLSKEQLENLRKASY